MVIEEQALLNEVTHIRRKLHMYPEKGFMEYNTSKFISEYLKDLGIQVITGAAKTGVIGIINGSEGAESIAVRADMDCLEVEEDTGVQFSSKNTGFMHACGHDGHTAALLGLARYLSSKGAVFRNNVVLIFQPAEEGPGGAKDIVRSGILDNMNIKAVLGMHIYPGIEQGMIGCCEGPITARNGEVDVKVTGKSAHGALPHTGIDSIVVSSQVIECVQSVVSRKIDPMENAVVTFGRIHGGEARNIIAGSVTMEGTIRAFNSQIYNRIKQSILDICTGLGRANDCSIVADIRDMYPEVHNDRVLVEKLAEAEGRDSIEVMKPLMISEDFSYYREIAPTLMFFLGSRNEDAGYTYPLHSSRFNFDEIILVKAVSVFNSLIKLLDK